jgi:hypothetical protein
MNTPEQYATIGHMATTLQRPYGVVVSAIARLKILPTLMLNGVGYFSAADEIKIHEYLTAAESEKHD